MKKLLIVSGMLCAFHMSAIAAPLYGEVEKGMNQDQVLKALRRDKSLEGPPSDALISRTGLNGEFKLKEPFAGQQFSLHFTFDKSKALNSVELYSRKKHPASAYDTKLKSAYKAVLLALIEQYGSPMNVPTWLDKSKLPEVTTQYIHMWKIKDGLFVYSGLAYDRGMFPIVRYSSAAGKLPSVKDELKPATLKEWEDISEFAGLHETESAITEAMAAMSKRKNKDALAAFQQAADEGSGRGCWGVAMIYEQGRNGVKRDKVQAEEYYRKAAKAGFAPAAKKYGATWADAAKKLGLSAKTAKAVMKERQRAAAEGIASEQYNQGFMEQNGFNGAKNLEKAKQWYQKAAKQGDVQAKAALKKLK